jgi:two-component system, NarL family, response regulator NreC
MIRAIVYLQRPLDRDAFAALLRQTPDVQVLATPRTELEVVAVSRLKRPDLVVLEAKLPCDGPIALAKGILANDYAGHVLFLADTAEEQWVRAAQELPRTIYVTRNKSFEELWQIVGNRLATADERAVLPIATRVDAAASTLQRVPRSQHSKLENLTKREVEILQRLAEGQTVQQCAASLNLAASTVDNHKSRIMKKLNVHRTVELALVAFREGLVNP